MYLAIYILECSGSRSGQSVLCQTKPSQILEINKTYFKFIADKVHGYQYCRQRGITLPDSTVLPVEKVLLFQVNKDKFLGMGTQEDKVSKNPLGCKQNHLNKRKGAKS